MPLALPDVHRLLESPPARRLSPAHDIWRLDSPPWWRFFRGFRRLEQTKRTLLRAAWRLELPLFLMPPAAPEVSGLLPFVEPRGDGIWRVRTDRSSDEFFAQEAVSSLGNWILYGSATPLATNPPDAFRAPPDALAEFLKLHEVALLIDSFHDDTSWCIALNLEAATEAADPARPERKAGSGPPV